MSHTFGHPKMPMTFGAVADKFVSVTTDPHTDEALPRASGVIDAVEGLELAEDARSVMDAVARTAGALEAATSAV